MKRRRLSKTERAALLDRQGGCCVTFGCSETKGLIEEHAVPFAWTGEAASQLMCVACHKIKTRADIAKIAKVKRIQKRERGEVKTKRKIAGRGFDKTRRKKMDGTVVKR